MKEKKKILIVDDDIDLLEQNKIMLEAENFEVLTAENSVDAWQLFQDQKPDAAILDLIMEEHDSGFILAYRIKKSENGKKVPVFLLTSSVHDTGMKFGVTSSEEKEWIHCDGWFNKPIEINQITTKLRDYFEEAESKPQT